MFKAKLDPFNGGECVIEKTVDWLHGTATAAEKEGKKGGKNEDSYNPFGSEAGDGEDLIEEYFAVEKKKKKELIKKAQEETKVDEENEEPTKSPQKDIAIEYPAGLDNDAEEELPVEAVNKVEEKEKKKKTELNEWLIVD